MNARPVPLWKLSPFERRQAREARRREKAAAGNPTRPAVAITTTQESPMSELPEVIHGVAATKFDRIVRDLQSAIQRKNDATTEHATEWKSAKDSGIHNQALKLCLKLDRESDDKRADFLRAFDVYRSTYFRHWEDQADMFDAAGAEAEAGGEHEGPAEETEEEPAPLAAQATSTAARTAKAKAEGEEAGEDDDATAPIEGGTDGAVAAYNEGRQAGLEGAEADSNPHPSRSAKSRSWKKGWQVGTGERNKVWLAATEEGASARRQGRSLSDNPHAQDVDPLRWKGWGDGWATEGERMLAKSLTDEAPAGGARVDGLPAAPAGNVVSMPLDGFTVRH